MSISELYVTDSAGGTLYDGSNGVEIVRMDDRVFVYSASTIGDRIVISELFADGRLDPIGTFEHVDWAGLNGASGFASTHIGTKTYLYSAGIDSNGVGVFEIAADGTLTQIQTIFEVNNPTFELDTVHGELTIATAGGNQFLIVQAWEDHGLSVFQIGTDGRLTNTDNVDDATSPSYLLGNAANTTAVSFNGNTFVFATGYRDDGFNVFSLSNTGQLTFLNSVGDSGVVELNGAFGIETTIINGTLFLYVASREDDNISVFTVDGSGAATSVFSYSDTNDIALNGASDLEMFDVNGQTFLAVTAREDSGVSVFSVGPDGSLSIVDSIFDAENTSLELDNVRYLDFVEIDGQALMVASAFVDDGVTVLRLDSAELIIQGTDSADLLFGTEQSESIAGLDGDDLLFADEGNDSVDAGQGDDLVNAGLGNDVVHGDGNLTQTVSGVVTVTETGQDLALSVTLPDSSDSSTIEISGLINRVPVQGTDYNIVYVIDISTSMLDSFLGTETVGDLNGDGTANTLLDGTIAAFQSLNDSLVASGFGSSQVGVITFGGVASTIYQGSALGSVNDTLAGLTTINNTNFEVALQETISTLGAMGSGQNVVYFISDGEHLEGSFTDEAATLIDDAGLNATITSFALGADANLDQLDLVDDNTDNDSVIQILEPSALTGSLTGAPVETSEVDRLEIYVNGDLVQTIESPEFVITPLGLQYQATISGLSTSSGDVIEAILIASDASETQVSAQFTVPNVALAIGDDTLIGGAGSDTLDGDGGNDTLFGETGDDLLVGGSGHDLLDGGFGADRLFGEAGNDTLSGGAGSDTLDGGFGDDLYFFEVGDTIDETGGAIDDFDTIATRLTTDLTNLRSEYLGTFEAIRLIGDIDATARGDNGDNRLEGNIGDNLLVGRGGNDTMNANDGDDLMSGGDGQDSMRGDAGHDTLYGNGHEDTLRGNDGNDDLFGGSGGDSLSGGGGNDSLDGGSGADILAGGDGNDRLNGGGNNDTVYGNDGDDTIIAETGHDYVSGGVGNDVIAGREHDDTLRGGTGDDRLYGGDQDDVLSGNDGDDLLEGGLHNDRLFGGAGNDTLEGQSGADDMSGGSNDDRLNGGGNHDTMAGDGGNDTLIGETGNDSMDGGTGNDILVGREHDDTIRGGDGADTLYGGVDEDLLVGNDGDDNINGGSDNDTLFGGSGADTLAGNNGTDLMSGGSGRDVFVFETIDHSPHGSSRDTISDFQPGEDQIDLSGFSGTLTFVTSYSGTVGEVRFSSANERLYIDLDGDSASDVSIDLTGVTTIVASDLIL